ncbi:MAG: hypothetical protein IKY95_02190 [Bacteroidales bacterium]|nr:hypothetical protein [Bacteroidales bacterium]MBR5300661.1 hypothetical protein [Bacteroidales bacterium]
MEIFYHGTCHLFGQFDMSFLGTGEGKSKFGNGIYITSSYETAALYAAKAARANGKDTLFVYTVEVPDLTDENHVFSCKEVNQAVVQRVEAVLGAIPQEATASGKYFRKYIGNVLSGKKASLKQMLDKADAQAENAASRFLDEVGIVYLAWPQAQTKPDGDTNRAVLNASNVRVMKIEQVQVNEKNKLINGSQEEITL